MTGVRITHIGGPTVLIEVEGKAIEREFARPPLGVGVTITA